MIGTAVTFGSLAVGAGLVAPRLRNWFLGDVAQDWLANELEFDAILPDDETVRLKSGELFRVIALDGMAYEAKTGAEEEHLLAIRTQVLMSLAENGCIMRLIGLKREIDLSFAADWPCQSLQEIGDRELELTRHSYELRWFVIIQNKNADKIVKGQKAVLSGLKPYGPRIVRAATDETTGCALTGFLTYLVCGEYRETLPRASRSVNGSIAVTDIHFEVNGLITTWLPRETYSRIVAVSSWPELVTGELLAGLLSITGDIEVVTILKPKRNVATATLYRRKVKEYETPMIANEQGAAEYSAAAELIGTGAHAIFETQTQIILRAPTQAALDELATEVCDLLTDQRARHSTETNGSEGKGAAVCWFNRIPGQDRLLRPLTLLDKPIAALWVFAASPRGLVKGPFGPAPARMFKTPSGSSYAFQFHVSDRPQSAGNFLVFAPTGGGKSTLMLHLLGGMAKYPDYRSYIFDSKEGARFMIEALGGTYQGFEELALNPLDVGERSSGTDQAILQMFRAMIGEAWEDGMEEGVTHATTLAMKQGAGQRTLNAIYSAAFSKATPIKRAMAKWVHDLDGAKGAYHHIFNAPQDSLSKFLSGSHLVGINMNEALEDPVLGPAVVTHIAQKIKAVGKAAGGFSIFVDEAANLLGNAGFRGLIMEMFQEIRKDDGHVGLAFQDPEALLNFEGRGAMLKNTQTMIFIPNSSIGPETLDAFSLSEEERDFVMGTRRVGAGRYVLVIKQDLSLGFRESAILNVDLTPFKEAMRFYRAGSGANRELQRAKSQWGATWIDHI